MSASNSEGEPTADRSSRSAGDSGGDAAGVRYEKPASGCGLGCAELTAVVLVIAASAALVLLLGI
ncbi:MAG: hypothetical protein GWO12_12060 [Gemmatimonadetes bacterium]|uniref:Uncharacterized protein n=1 Tax=Candidatus Kutchimonas denitrificans TaxID=3056748 RepID=A0AAE5CBG2_9BACT|nr:hypothetical protein [Candidatus Kutchimonas denitrificans]